MESIFMIAAIVFLIVFLYAQESKKETTREKYGEAIGQVAYSAASSIAGIAQSIAEPASKKEIRLAREDLASRNGMLYRFEHYSHKEHIKELLEVDISFKKSLEIIGLSEERWKKLGKHIFYVGIIEKLSRKHSDYTKKNEEFIRDSIIHTWINKPSLKDYSDTLCEALDYFNISKEEWIKYGDAVIEMYNINDNKDVEEYGIIA